MNQTMLRAAYVSSSVDTMSPGRMIVARYDRLMVDLERAEQAIVALDPSTAHNCLIHAQSIVSELHDTLDAARVVSCRDLDLPLRDAWTKAAGIVPSAGGTA